MVRCALAVGFAVVLTAAEASIDVVPRTPSLATYPCSNCHRFIPSNPEWRDLGPHPIELRHGGGAFWCLECHDAEDRDKLRPRGAGPISFDASHTLCATCHAAVVRTWQRGAHGQPASERQVYGCAHCHDPHDRSLRAVAR